MLRAWSTRGSCSFANRGEIAARVFSTCRRLGIRTVAVAAPDDAHAFHARVADEPLRSRRTSTRTRSSAALDVGAALVHPGYGFLAESAFAEAVSAAGLLWVGPPSDVLRRGGDKRGEADRRRPGVPTLRPGRPRSSASP
jgi:acetyl/propionyl-CoA carboxylase alpha subunit